MEFNFDFQIVEYLSDDHVTGRHCGKLDLLLGTEFQFIYRRVFPAFDPSNDLISPEPEFVRSICLRLDSIEFCRQQVEYLNPGHTAKLGLAGEGLIELRELLEKREPRTWYSLVAD